MDLRASDAPRRTLSPTTVRIVDAAVSAALTGGALVALAGLHYTGPVVFAVLSCAGTTTAVAYRRAAPVTAAVIAMTSFAVYQRTTLDPLGTFVAVALVLTFYTLGRTAWAQRHYGRAVGALAYAFVTVTVANGSGGARLGSPGGWIPFALVPFVVGLLTARRDRLTTQLALAFDALAREQEARAAQAVAEERNRIARELHDVVAHDVSVMVIQAGAARLVAADDPLAARQALGVVEDSGRDAIGELRKLMGVLRRDDEVIGAGAGLARVDALIGRVRAAGVDAVLYADPALPALASALDLVAYRLVQEALTNVVKHGGPGATAEVRISFDGTDVAIEVRNTAGRRQDRDVSSIGGGRGLAGMRERVALYGGHLDTNSGTDGSFSVRARLPVARTAPVEPVARAHTMPPPVAPHDQLSGHGEQRVDAAIAVVWLTLLEIEVAVSAHRHGPLWANAVAVAAMTIAAVGRRRSPLLFLVFVGVIAVTLGGGLTSMKYGTLTGTYTLAVPLFTVSAWSTRRYATIGLTAWVTGATLAAMYWHAPVGGYLGAMLMGCVIWTTGRVTRSQRSLAARLEHASQQLVAARQIREEFAVTQERGRIARDLHALVSHGVVAMIIQAEGARALLDHHPGRAADAAHAVEQAGREALARMRDVLGMLRSGDGPAPRTPATPSSDLDGAVA